ncbi:MAG TPA: hypothetical protein GX506_09385 [Firmicutes bacterium]|nr:hypothetical protein [Bacillota bacterium]
MTASDRDTQIMLSQCVFFVDPRAKLSRKELQEWLVELALYQAAKPLNVDEIAASIFTEVLPIHGHENAFRPRWTNDACNRLLKKGRINASPLLADLEESQSFILSTQRRTQLDMVKCRFDNIIKQFETLVERAYKAAVKNNTFSPEQEEAIIRATHLTVQNIFIQNAIRLAALMELPSRKRYFERCFENNHEEIRGYKVLSEQLTSIFGEEDVRVPKISNAIIEILLSEDPIVQQYLTICHHKVLYSYILDIDPSLQKYQSELLKQRIIIFDTNVIIAMMFKKHRRHTVVQNLFEDAQRLNMKFGVFTWTVQEIKYYLDGAKKDLLNYKETFHDQRKFRRIEHIVWELLEIKGPSPHFDIPFLDSYFAAYEPNYWLKEKNIEIYDVIRPNDEDGLIEAESILNEHKLRKYDNKETPKPNALEHDALCLLGVNKLRKNEDANITGPSIWFLTLDMSLASAEREIVRYRKIYSFPCSLRVNDFIEELMAYEAPQMSVEKYYSYISLLVESWIAAVDFDEEINSEELLSSINNPALPVLQILESGDERAEYQIKAFMESHLSQSFLDYSMEQDKHGSVQGLNVVLDQMRKALEREAKQHEFIHYSKRLQEEMERLEQLYSERLSREKQEIMAEIEGLRHRNSQLQDQLLGSINLNKRLKLYLGAVTIIMGASLIGLLILRLLR